ncbi:TPA: hypothetical protein KEY68_001880 [Providencia rettgeri]|nr:hypothetical protein [Providencia rettgeri]
MERLIKTTKKISNEEKAHLQDILAIVARNIEDSLLAQGATPNKDYNYIDLYKIAATLIDKQNFEQI